MDFVLALHSHLPYVLNHGRWPHGSDWITEAAVDTYLPLIDSLQALAAEQIAAPVTLGITPILANQLTSPVFEAELRQFLNQRLEACDEAESQMASTYDAHLIPVVRFWRERFARLLDLYDEIGADIVGAFANPATDGGALDRFAAPLLYYAVGVAGDDTIRDLTAVQSAFEPYLTGLTAPNYVNHPREPQRSFDDEVHTRVERVRRAVDPTGMFAGDVPPRA